ncbi:MAG: hypothetical protein MUE94_07205 [Verrucomicrobia bacterium]|nr:hypothetical protein [Verrucomicrobiota bacterium]
MTFSNSLSLGGVTVLRLKRTNLVNCDRVVGMTTVTYGGTLQRGTGGTFTLSWPPNQGWTLQQSTNLPGAWLDVATTTNSYQVVPAQPRQFYRLKLGP